MNHESEKLELWRHIHFPHESRCACLLFLQLVHRAKVLMGWSRSWQLDQHEFQGRLVPVRTQGLGDWGEGEGLSFCSGSLNKAREEPEGGSTGGWERDLLSILEGPTNWLKEGWITSFFSNSLHVAVSLNIYPFILALAEWAGGCSKTRVLLSEHRKINRRTILTDMMAIRTLIGLERLMGTITISGSDVKIRNGCECDPHSRQLTRKVFNHPS